ncbi:hypothetical protein CLV78_10997 [Aliiruegeria haliotis]|uniref:DUF4440 domain-containing protein n=1 Tax=Aliiruegeria haliotis TaxID=1280846 RepID=A0A2T0RJW5_9RHOB|nr:nuclear transport factor 2 family protein [Aliiruegeria haliotis]PRY21484.1 hypothetical protein CLV78_10997 [Aliiruegeria haliotis]
MSRSDLETILHHEKQVWDALATGDRAAEERLLSDDFLGVYESGTGDKAEHVGQLAAGPTVARYAISDPILRELAPGLVLLVYRADYLRVGAAPGMDEAMRVSSIWQRHEDGGWRNIFSQDTAVGSIRPV